MILAKEYLVVSREPEFIFTSPFPIKSIYLPKVFYYFKHKIKLEKQLLIPFLMARNPTIYNPVGSLLLRQFSKMNGTSIF